MKCSKYGSSPLTDGQSIFRNGEKGSKSEWRCLKHLDKEWRNEFLEKKVAEIESLNKTKH